ncbi:MAG: hypothetical protein AAFR67_10790, partial [Chloroflexota bacterium]
MNALRRAWNQVQRSGKSPGTDGMTPEEFGKRSNHHLNRLRQQIIGGSYEPYPVRQFFVKKKSGKLRPIRIWTVRDKVAQRVVVDAITTVQKMLFKHRCDG